MRRLRASPRTVLALLLAALAAALVAGCGGGGSEDGGSTGGDASAGAGASSGRATGADGASGAGGPSADDDGPALSRAATRAARRALAGRRGAVAALDLADGRVRVLTGTGGGDPTAELVAPGSTLKTLFAGIALEDGVVGPAGPLEGDEAPVPGAENAGGARLGPLTVAEALATSSNTAFASLNLRLGPERVERAFRAAGWGRRVAIDLPADRRAAGVADVAPFVGADGRYVDPDLHQRASVLQLALLAAAAGGDGTVPRARLRGDAPEGTVGRLWGPDVAAELRRGLRLAVTDGTGATMRDPGLPIAAKTGTMGRPDGTIQASVIAVAPHPRPTVALAVSVVAPAGSTGGEAAGPVARAVLKALDPR